jgi:hypothetical protein
MVGSVCHVKQFTIGYRHCLKGCNGGAEVPGTTAKKLLCYRFRYTSKAMGQVCQCWWRMYQEMNVFSRFKYHMLYILFPFVSYLLTLPHTITLQGNDNQRPVHFDKPSNYAIDDSAAKSVVIKTSHTENMQVTVMLTELVDNIKLPP